MAFHICEKRHWNSCPVSLEVTSKTPTKVLIAPPLASDGLKIESLCFSGVSVATLSTSRLSLALLRARHPHRCDSCAPPRPLQHPTGRGGLGPAIPSPAPPGTVEHMASGCNDPSARRARFWPSAARGRRRFRC